MSNFICPHCGMENIDCGSVGYKTPREIELEKNIEDLEIIINTQNYIIKGYEEQASDYKKSQRIHLKRIQEFRLKTYRNKKLFQQIKSYCGEQNFKYDTTALEVLSILEGFQK